MRAGAIAVTGAWALLLAVSPGHAATLCVNPGGTGGCFASLADAAAAAPRVATVEIAAGTYHAELTLPLGSKLTIRGAGIGSTNLDYLGPFDAVRAEGRGTLLALSDLTLRDRSQFNDAGGVQIANGARAVVERLRFVGTGIAAASRAQIDVADSSFVRGGIGCSNGSADVRRATIVEAGAAISAEACRLTVSDSRLTRNGSGIVGSGITGTGDTGGSTVIRRCVIARNEHSGLKYHGFGSVSDKIEVWDSTVSGNGHGSNDINRGAIRVEGARSVKIVRSTITGNSTSEGAVSTQGAPLTMIASTVSGNVGQGLLVWIGVDGRPPLVLSSSTITGNTESGLACLADACGPVSGTIIAGNGTDCREGTLLSGGFNLAQSATDCVFVPGRDPDLIGVDPLLGPLADNGGPTATHALLPGSPAIGAIVRGAGCSKPDQRGVKRQRPCDVGAYESTD